MRKAKVLLVITTAVVVISLILTSCTVPVTATHSSHNTPVSEVKVSRYGFNDISGEFLLEVEKGQEVEITFVYEDGDLSQNNPHIIGAPEYGITTGILDQANPEVTVRFTATETGEVALMCVQLECIGHHNLHGEAEEEHHHEQEEPQHAH